MEMCQIGERLKYLRLKKNYTQSELSLKTSLSVVQLSRYETNARKPDIDSLRLLADCLDTSTDYILGRINDPNLFCEVSYQEILKDQLSNTKHDSFIHEYMEASEEQKNELVHFWRLIQDAEKGRKLIKKNLD